MSSDKKSLKGLTINRSKSVKGSYPDFPKIGGGEKLPVPMELEVKKLKKGKENRPLTTKEKEEIVKKVCSGEIRKRDSSKSEKRRSAKEAANIYSDLHAEYYNHRPVDWMGKVERHKGLLGCFSRAVSQAEMMGVDVEDYLRAQFWAIDQVFRRAPTYAEIASLGAIKRYEQWNGIVREGKAPRKVIHVAVHGNIDPSKTTYKEEEKYHRWALEGMIKMHGTEEDVWEIVGDPEDETFPLWFKQKREVWLRMFGGEKES